MQEIIILGAGLAGLGCARNYPGARVFEAQSHPGGHAYSHELGGFSFDKGAHISHSRDSSFIDLTSTKGDSFRRLTSVVASLWKNIWIGYPVQNHLRDIPMEGRIEALSDLVVAHADRIFRSPHNYMEWCHAQYGKYLAEEFYRTFTQKYWRCEPEDLDTDWLGGRLLPSVLPKIVRGAFQDQGEQQAAFATFRYPKNGGFFSFFSHLYPEINITYNQRVIHIDTEQRLLCFQSGRRETFQTLASSIPLPDLISAIATAPDEIRAAAKRLRYTKLLCVNMIVSKSALTPNHWFYVYDHDLQPARISVLSNLCGAEKVPMTALQAEIFRRCDELWDVEQLTQTAIMDLGKILHFDPDKDLVIVEPLVVPYAYVVSDSYRRASVTTILEWLKAKGIYSMGLYGQWSYIWSDAAYRAGEAVAKQISEMPYR